MATTPTVVPIELGARAYDVRIGSGVLGELGGQMRGVGLGRRAVVVTHPGVGRHYLAPVMASLAAAGVEVGVLNLPAGERHKRLATVEKIWAAGLEQRLDRGGVLVALGGGVLGDMVGFAAACYYRGISFVQLPTTLLAMVDSSVGGKTGVNFQGKNLVGAFWQPRLVLADLDTLATLPARELRCGLAEVIKHGAILDLDLFERLERALVEAPTRTGLRLAAGARGTLTPDLARLCVERSCQLKGAVVAADEREAGQRAWLNFGHTFGHALESVCGYRRLRHGEAVAVGMVLAARLGARRGDLAPEVETRLARLCAAVGLPVRVPGGVDPQALWAAMLKDKKTRDGTPRLTLLAGLGRAMVTHDTPAAMIENLLAEACAEGNDADR